MIFSNIQDIKSPFLKTAATMLSKKYSLEDIYMNESGELCLTFKGILTEDSIQSIIDTITPRDYGFDYYTISSSDYCYNKDKQKTHVYSIDAIDYRYIV